MDHLYYRDKISAYSDGALEAQERELIRRHLEECAECRNLLDKLNKLSAVIEGKSGLKNDEYFENLAKKIERRISIPEEKVVDVRSMRWNSFWLKISAAAATIVLVGTIGFYQYEDGQEMPTKLLDDLKMNREVAPVRTDSVTTDEPVEFQGGSSESKELVGKVAEVETPQVKAEESISLNAQEKAKPVVADGDIIDKYSSSSSQTIITKPSETKEKSSDETAAPTKKTDFSGVRVMAETPVIVTSNAANDSVVGQQLSLVQWRSQRDSIQKALGLEQSTAAYSMNNQMKELAAPSVSGLAKAKDSTNAYQELANSWFQIALQTEDSKEKAKAIEYLNWYKNRFPTDSPTVILQLQQIPK